MASQAPNPEQHGQRWSEGEDRIIYEAFLLGKTSRIMSLQSGRSASGVRQRLQRLGLIDNVGRRVIDPPLFEVIQARHHAAKRVQKKSRQPEDDL